MENVSGKLNVLNSFRFEIILIIRYLIVVPQSKIYLNKNKFSIIKSNAT